MDDELPYGWTAPQLAALARYAAHKIWVTYPGFEERADVGALAIIECLYTSDTPPTRNELLTAAIRTVEIFARKDLRQAGADDGHGHTGAGFAAYWHGMRRGMTPMEERLEDNLALYQTLPMVSEPHREILKTVARHWGDRTAAAAELGMTRDTLITYLSRARAEFRWYWFWPEAPPRHWGRDRDSQPGGRAEKYRAMGAVRRRRADQRKRETA